MSKLLLPLVATGNVPQLMTDLILHSLNSDFEFVRELDSMYLFAFTGPLDFVEGSKSSLYENSPDKTLTTPLELFYSKKFDLYIVQQRSPVLQPYDNNFCKQVLLPLIEETKITTLIVADAFEDYEELIASGPAQRSKYSLGVCDISQVDNLAGEFQQKLQLKDSNTAVNNTLFKFTDSSFQSAISTEQLIFKLCYHLFHASKLTHSLKEIRYFNTYVQEGDNSEDAAAACDQIPNVIPGFPRISKYQVPVSWNGVYGVRNAPTDFEEGLYI